MITPIILESFSATITGGSLIAAGASGMAQNFGSSSTQGSILVTFTTQSAGTTISLLDELGNELISWQSGKTYSSVVISSPDITVGSTYTIKAGDYETTVTMDSVIYGNGMGMGGGFPGGNGGMGGQRPDRGNNNYDGQMPDGNGMGGQRPDNGNNNSNGQMPDGNGNMGDMTPPDGNGGMTPPNQNSNNQET